MPLHWVIWPKILKLCEEEQRARWRVPWPQRTRFVSWWKNDAGVLFLHSMVPRNHTMWQWIFVASLATIYTDAETSQLLKASNCVVYSSYNNNTGIFTVPIGGAGIYYFSAYFMIGWEKLGQFVLGSTEGEICRAMGDHDSSGAQDFSQAGCSGVAQLEEGKVWVCMCCSWW